jgi:homocysteine S-methyltransferase
MTEITLLDGSIGQELVKRSNDRATPLWSTQVMMDHPDLVGDVHRDYIASGATVLTTNTYAVHRSRLERVGLADRMEQLLNAALEQAEAARSANEGGRIAGALGPLLASYRPDLMPDVASSKARFGEIIQAMGDRVDLLLAETVSSVLEGQGVCEAAAVSDKPLWLAFSVDDQDGTRLRSGEALQDVASLIATYKPAAVLLNCSTPEAIDTGLPVLATMGVPYGAYANGFTKISDGFKAEFPTVDALEARTDLTPAAYADYAMAWVAQGATIIGGCCEVGPAHIQEIAKQLRAAGHKLV